MMDTRVVRIINNIDVDEYHNGCTGDLYDRKFKLLADVVGANTGFELANTQCFYTGYHHTYVGGKYVIEVYLKPMHKADEYKTLVDVIVKEVIHNG